MEKAPDAEHERIVRELREKHERELAAAVEAAERRGAEEAERRIFNIRPEEAAEVPQAAAIVGPHPRAVEPPVAADEIQAIDQERELGTAEAVETQFM